MNLPTDIQARRNFEDTLATLGQQRAELYASLGGNTSEIKRLLGAALDAGVTMETIAKLTRVSRQTLHQWRSETGLPASAASR
jgi:hypothetical protein